VPFAVSRGSRVLTTLLASVIVAGLVPLLAPTAAGAALAPKGDDTVLTFGAAGFYGSTEGKALAAPLVGSAPTPSGHGYWLVAADGGIFSYGDAAFHGSTGGIHLNRPIISMAATRSGHGYWMVASDGGVFSFGDAKFYGSTGALVLNSPVIAMAPTPSGHGYWLVAADGGIFSFGDAKFFGSTGGLHLNSGVVGMAATPKGLGYWLVARDGGIFSFGDAKFFGSTGALHLNAPIVGMAATPLGDGYWLGARDGGIFSFGNAPFEGSGSGHVSSIDQVIQITGIAHGFGYRMLVAPLPFNTPVLSPGASGAAVVALQQHLLALGYWIDGASGSYGLTTTQAVYAFQKVEGLPRSGIVDIQTSQRLVNARRPVPRSTTGYVAEVDKPHQVIKIALNGRTLWVINTSTGSGIPYVLDGTRFTAQTPEGHFTVVSQINGLDVSPLGTLWRPKFFTGTGIAFHGSPSIPPFPASHGCVRMTNAAIDWIWASNTIPIGTAVWVY
jgi:peptidoglycan hydrolase-like protein with peptidoglycan-binding domain/ribosomal protein L24E